MELSIIEDLRVLAQIAITLIGFTGIIGVLQSRGGNVLTSHEKLHLVGLLMFSSLVILLAFVPGWIFLLPDIENKEWTWIIRILFLVHIAAWLVAYPVLASGGMLLRKFPLVDRIGASVVSLIGVTAVVAEAFILFGFYESYSPVLYESVLLFFLGSGLFNFMRLLLLPLK